MSWVSNAKNAFLNLLAGKPAGVPIIERPTTPLETAINLAAGVILPAAALIPGANEAAMPIEAISAVVNDASHPASAATGDFLTTLGNQAKTAADQFLTSNIGATGTAIADASAQALATAAIGTMSSSSNKTAEEIADALHEFLTGFFGPAPAAAKE